jgi:hypothetical protein
MTPHFSSNRLRLSLLWFALLAGIFSALVTLSLAKGAPNLGELVLPAIQATILCSLLFWWLLIVRPQRVTVVRGGLAGILSVVLAMFVMWVEWGIASGKLFEPGYSSVLFLGLITMLVVIISPFGWLLMAIGGSIGGGLAFFTRRWALDTTYH